MFLSLLYSVIGRLLAILTSGERAAEQVRLENLVLRHEDAILRRQVKRPVYLDRVLRIYVRHYNQKRPHRGLQLWAPERATPIEELDTVPDVRRRDRLGRLIHKYEIAA